MGIIKISEEMHEEVRVACKAMSRSINAQAEHWMRIGMVAESNPGMSYADIIQQLLAEARQLDSLQVETQGTKKGKSVIGEE